MSLKKIAIIGNPCSGKTTLSHLLAKKYDLPIIHVDSIQFLDGMRLRNPAQTRQILLEASNAESWIIDGHGPLKIIEDRFQKADRIYMIRIPLYKNYFWMLKRTIKLLFSRRPEIQSRASEVSINQIFRLIKNIWNTERGLWPQLDRIFLDDKYKGKVVRVCGLKEAL